MNAVHERTEIFEVQSFLSEPILKFFVISEFCVIKLRIRAL